MRLNPKRWLPLALLAAGALGAAGVYWLKDPPESRPERKSAPLVRAVAVRSEPVSFVVRAHGTVVPRTESEVVPQVAGEVVWVSPSFVSGGFFEAEESLVRIERADYEVERESARASVARFESELARAEKELGRQRSLAEREVASQSRIDDAENAFQVASASLRESRARLSRATRDLGRTEIRAPYAGRVRSEEVDVGQFVSRGAAIARIYAVDYAEVRLPVPDRELAFVDLPLAYRPESEAQGAMALVRLSAEFAGRPHTWTGQVVRTEGEIDAQTRMVNVVARVDDPYNREGHSDRPPFAVGLFVEAEIVGRELEAAIVLPRAALREGDQVLVVDDETRLRFRKVEVLRAEREQIVVGEGLREGERVCVSPLAAPVEGMRVRVSGDPAPEAAS